MTAGKLLLFRSGGRAFAVDAGAVLEILPDVPSTRIPGAPAAVRGLANVRGTLVTVVDAARAVGVSATPGAEGASIVLLEQRSRPVGLVVDEVFDLVSAEGAALDDHASLPGVRPDVVRAVGTVGGETFVQLAIDVLLEPLLP